MIFFIYYINTFINNIYNRNYVNIIKKNKNLNLLENYNNIDNNFPAETYKKTITSSKLLKNYKRMEYYNYNTSIIIPNKSINKNTIITFIKNKYTKIQNIKYELQYIISKKTKIYIHIDLIFPRTNIYHIGITFRSILHDIRYDISGMNLDKLYNFFANNLVDEMYSKTIFWDYSDKTLPEIINYENNLQYKYILGISDCRHYVRNLTMWACNNPTPIWRLDNLV